MYGVYPGFLYPGLYGYGVEVLVPPTRPPSLCLTSGVTVRCLATSEVACESEAVSACVEVRAIEACLTEQTRLVVCDIDVTGTMTYETLECRGFVTSDVGIRYEDVGGGGGTLPPSACAEVTVRCLVTGAIDCRALEVVAEVAIQSKVTSDVAFCCVERKCCS